MKRIVDTIAFVVVLAVTVLVGFVGTAKADSTTYSIQVGDTPYTVVKPNYNAAVYTDGSRIFVTAIGASITRGNAHIAQPNAVTGTINEEPVSFIVPPSH